MLIRRARDEVFAAETSRSLGRIIKSPGVSRNMSPTPASSAELRGHEWLHLARTRHDRTPGEEMMTEDAKFALGF
jgi:hypothetical protein